MRAPAFLVLLAAGCGLVSGLDSLHVDDAGMDANANDVAIPLPDGDTGAALSSLGGCSSAPGTTTLALTGIKFTIELWLSVKAPITDAGAIAPILWKGGRTTSEPGWSLDLTAGGLVFCLSDSTSAKCSTPGAITVGDLVHVAVISDVTTTRSAGIYTRDVTKNEPTHSLAGGVTDAVVDWGTSSNFTIGGGRGAALCASAPSVVVDELRVYDHALVPSDLDSELATIPCDAQGLLAYFKFDEGTGTTASDCSAAKLLLTLGQNATFVPSPFP